jgi:hypothetical protein
LQVAIARIANLSPAANFTRIRLHFEVTRLIHGMAATAAKGEHNMNEIPAETAGTEQTVPAEEPKAAKKPRVAAHSANVAPVTPRSGKKAASAKKANTARKSAKKAASVRQGSKTASILGLLQRSGGATMNQLTKATGWQKHSVRGFLSGALRKKMGLTVTSTKAEGGERRYSVKG